MLTSSLQRRLTPPQPPPSALPFTPLTFAFRDVRYWVPLPADQAPDGTQELQLLCGISGVFSPGVLACLMGESGAGKTTLLDVLANRCAVV